jgi:hypothetical protein
MKPVITPSRKKLWCRSAINSPDAVGSPVVPGKYLPPGYIPSEQRVSSEIFTDGKWHCSRHPNDFVP